MSTIIAYYNSTAINYTTTCFPNLSLTEEQKEFFAQRLDGIYRTYQGWLAFPLALLGLLLTTLYILAVCRAIRLRRVSRKCYVLLINRALGDIFGCFVAWIIIIYALTASRVNRDFMQLLDTFFIGTFWAGMVSYVALSVLKLYAIARPLHYRNNVTMMKCIYLMIFSWIFFFILTSYAIVVTALVKIPALNEWSGCKIETCMRGMYRRRNLAVSIVYFFTIGCFLVTLLLVRKATQLGRLFHQKSESNANSTKKGSMKRISNRFPLWKLALNVVTFAVFNLLYVIWAVALTLNRDACFFQRNYATMMRYMGIVRASLLMRIVMDPLLSFITDYHIRRSMLYILGITNKVSFVSQRRDTLQSDGNSSECMNYNNNNNINKQASTVTTITTVLPAHQSTISSTSPPKFE